MDPNEALRLLRLTIKQMRVDEHPDIRAAHADEIAEYVEALDEWLSKGGFLPSAWQGGARFDYSSSASRQHYIDTGEYIDPLGHPDPAHSELPVRDDDYTAEAINRTVIEDQGFVITVHDHDARPDDDPEPGDRCKDCGRRITWVGPSHLNWRHV